MVIFKTTLFGLSILTSQTQKQQIRQTNGLILGWGYVLSLFKITIILLII